MTALIKYHYRSDDLEPRVLNDLTRQVVRAALHVGQANEQAEVSVLYVDDEEMRQLNKAWRGIARPTDVLSFPLQEGESLPARTYPSSEEAMLGDVVISLDTASRQAARHRHSLRREVAILLVHGVLHLLGHDHHTGDRPADIRRTERMHAAELACLDTLQEKLII